jgi:hypothetical protein
MELSFVNSPTQCYNAMMSMSRYLRRNQGCLLRVYDSYGRERGTVCRQDGKIAFLTRISDNADKLAAFILGMAAERHGADRRQCLQSARQIRLTRSASRLP